MIAPRSEERSGALVLSLDFELQWGLRERSTPEPERVARLSGARNVVPRLLELFEEFDVAATWATVGFLFAETRDELLRFTPTVRPTYHDRRLSPFEDGVGDGEEDDPFHYAASLVRRIQRTPRQEIATHTFSHYYCREAGQTRDSFRADLEAACAIAAYRGIQLRSIVFPRNQHNSRYDDILHEMGIRAYRGNPHSSGWHFGDAKDSRRVSNRLRRLMSTYVGGAAEISMAWSEAPQAHGLTDVRASAMLRPYIPALRHLEPLRLNRIRRSLRFAAAERRIFHLWWHPHNFGLHSDENLTFLRRVLQEFARCRERYGMRSLSMMEVDGVVRGEPVNDPESAPVHG